MAPPLVHNIKHVSLLYRSTDIMVVFAIWINTNVFKWLTTITTITMQWWVENAETFTFLCCEKNICSLEYNRLVIVANGYFIYKLISVNCQFQIMLEAVVTIMCICTLTSTVTFRSLYHLTATWLCTGHLGPGPNMTEYRYTEYVQHSAHCMTILQSKIF